MASHSPPTAIPTANPINIIQALKKDNKCQATPWTHEETLNLIRAYQEKWYSLKRGQLKASQWEEVAVTVAARCSLDEPSKSATQCRHKIEKLRKRYRAEKQKQQQQQQQQPPFSQHHHHSWVYFPLMDQLERGPLPISAVPPIKSPLHDRGGDDDGAGDNRKEFDKRVDGLLRAGRKMGGFGDGYGGNLKNLKKMKGYWEEEEEEEDEDGVEEEEEEEEEGEDEECGDDFLMGELAAQMRQFSEKFVRMERKKMDMIREIERYKMEMENKRMEMILVSQQKTVDLISKVFASSHKKMKTTQDLP